MGHFYWLLIVLTCGFCKLGLMSCCPQNSQYICNCCASGHVDWTPAPCHRRTCVDPWWRAGWRSGSRRVQWHTRYWQKLHAARWLKDVHKYLHFRYISIGLCWNYCFPLYFFHCVLSGQLQNWSPSTVTYICMQASASASLHLYTQLGPCWLAWTTITTSTDQPREKLMAQSSMLYYKYSYAWSGNILLCKSYFKIHMVLLWIPRCWHLCQVPQTIFRSVLPDCEPQNYLLGFKIVMSWHNRMKRVALSQNTDIITITDIIVKLNK